MLGGAAQWGDGADRPAISAWQFARLKETVAWARERSLFYRVRLDGYPEPESLEQLRYLPFTTPQDLCGDPLRFLCVSQSAVRRVVTLETSGTTSAPKRLFFTDDDLETTLNFFHRGL